MAKSKYESVILPNLDKIEKWVKDGGDLKEIARLLGIAYSTLRKYIDDGEKGDERYSALSAVFMRAREVPDAEVEAALYKLATGYTVSLQKTFKVKVTEYDEYTGKRIREREELVTGYDQVHIPANATAQMFYLANRLPTRWQYKPDGKSADDKGESGVVMLAPVMPKPEEPEGGVHE